jgi:hypothetical protein
MSLAQSTVRMTVADFLAWEERQELRWEFDGFAPVAMTGGTEAHEIIQINLVNALTNRLRGTPCRAYGSNLKIRVPVGKAYSGYTDQELVWLDRWIRNHTVSRFGPVREVEKSLVLEVIFDAAQLSNRHKSGVAMRFPRILRIRKDKPASEADRLENLMNLVEKGSAATAADEAAD